MFRLQRLYNGSSGDKQVAQPGKGPAQIALHPLRSRAAILASVLEWTLILEVEIIWHQESLIEGSPYCLVMCASIVTVLCALVHIVVYNCVLYIINHIECAVPTNLSVHVRILIRLIRSGRHSSVICTA